MGPWKEDLRKAGGAESSLSSDRSGPEPLLLFLLLLFLASLHLGPGCTRPEEVGAIPEEWAALAGGGFNVVVSGRQQAVADKGNLGKTVLDWSTTGNERPLPLTSPVP